MKYKKIWIKISKNNFKQLLETEKTYKIQQF